MPSFQKVKYLRKELEKRKPDINKEYMLSEKIDGWFVSLEYNRKSGFKKVISSANRIIPSMEHTQENIWNFTPDIQVDCILIMEAYIPDQAFHITNGIFNRSTGNYACFDVHFLLHDIIRVDSTNCIFADKAIDRNRLIKNFCKHEQIIESKIIKISKDQNVWQREFDKIVTGGGEGIILKEAEGLYHPGKRNSSLMKIKQAIELDLEIVEVTKTIGEKGNLAYNVVCKRENGTLITTVVPKHSDIEYIEQNSVIGMKATIGAMKVLEGGSLREPKFRHFRKDLL